MMKRILGIICSAAMTLSLVSSFTGINAAADKSGDFEYEVLDNTSVEITKYTGSASNVSIPEKIAGKSVTSIGGYAFLRSNITSITISNGVTSIGDFAFGYANSLSKVTLPDTITKIGMDAFYNCAILNSQSTDVKYVGKWAVDCADYASNVSIKANTVGICDSMFANCNVESIALPKTLRYIGSNAFIRCRNLTAFTVASGNKYYSSDSGVLFNSAKTALVKYPQANTRTSYSIPSGVKKISSNAFDDTVALTKVVIPATVTEIADKGIYKCYKLKTILIPSTVKTIGNKAIGYWVDSEHDPLKIDSFKIYCYSGTAGEKYAKDEGFAYQLVKLPGKVGGLKAAATSASAIKLSWNKVSGANGYIVYQKKSGKWSKIKTLTANSLNVKSLKAGTTYTFAVKAYKNVAGQAVSSANYPTLTTSTNPAKVNFKLTAGFKKATVKWSKVTGAGGYKIYYKTSKNGKWVGLKTTNNKTTSYTKTGLKKAKTYWFTVRAYRKVSNKTFNSSFDTKSVKVK